MPRAMGYFRRARFSVEPWPVDCRAPRWLDLTLRNRSITDGLSRIDGVVREHARLAVYYLAGWTDALFPAR